MKVWPKATRLGDEFKPFAQADQPIVRYLTSNEVYQLVDACPGDFRQLVQGALLTGCRLGELTRMTVDDFDPSAKSVVVRVSKGGKARHVHLTDEAVRFFQWLAEHRSATKTSSKETTRTSDGASASPLLFVRESGNPWARSEHHRPMRRACAVAGIVPAISFHILRHTYASHLAMHDVDLPIIAHNLGHADTRITSRHYAHLAPSYIAERIRESGVSIGFSLPCD